MMRMTFIKHKSSTRIFEEPRSPMHHFPRPFGVFYETDRPCYETIMSKQIDDAKAKRTADLDQLLRGKEVWMIKE